MQSTARFLSLAGMHGNRNVAEFPAAENQVVAEPLLFVAVSRVEALTDPEEILVPLSVMVP